MFLFIGLVTPFVWYLTSVGFVRLTIIAMSMNTILLPILLIGAIIFTNKKEWIGEGLHQQVVGECGAADLAGLCWLWRHQADHALVPVEFQPNFTRGEIMTLNRHLAVGLEIPGQPRKGSKGQFFCYLCISNLFTPFTLDDAEGVREDAWKVITERACGFNKYRTLRHYLENLHDRFFFFCVE